MKRLVTLLAALAALQTYAQRIEATLPSPDAKSLGMGGVMMTTLSGSHAIYNNSATAIFSHTPSQVSSSYYGQRSFDYYAVSGFCRFDNINLVEGWYKQIPLRRGGTPEDVAKVALFLASDLSSYVSGQVIHCCGAMNC